MAKAKRLNAPQPVMADAAKQDDKIPATAMNDVTTVTVNPKTGRPMRKSAGRKSLGAGFVDPQLAIDGDDTSSASSSSDEDSAVKRSKRPRRVQRPRSPPAPPLSPCESDTEGASESLMSVAQDSQAQSVNNETTITVNVLPGHSGPIVIKLDLGPCRPAQVRTQSLSDTIQVTGSRKRKIARAAVQPKQPKKRSKHAEEQGVGFLSLAPEIRNMIYTLVLVTEEPIDLARPTNFSRTSALLRTCKAVEAEASQILYGKNSFRFERQFRTRARYYEADWIEVGWKDVRRWLVAVGPLNISHLQNILLKFDDAMPSSNPHLHTPEDRRYVHDENLIECLKMLSSATSVNTMSLNFAGRKQLYRTDFRFLEYLMKLRADHVKILEHPSWKEGTWVGYEGYHRGSNRIAPNVQVMVLDKMVNKTKIHQHS